MAEQPNLIGGEEGARLLAHPLPNLKHAVYPTEDAENPAAIFEDERDATSWALDKYGTAVNVRPIVMFSDTMPVARPRWRAES